MRIGVFALDGVAKSASIGFQANAASVAMRTFAGGLKVWAGRMF
jgi:hypothetical protein